jgi:hypothetical protein
VLLRNTSHSLLENTVKLSEVFATLMVIPKVRTTNGEVSNRRMVSGV